MAYGIQTSRILKVNNMAERLSELIARRIRELDLSNAELARRTGLTRGYIGNIVNETAPTRSGQYNLSQSTIAALARELKITETEILTSMGYLKNESEIPERIAAIGFDELDEQDIREIADFIKFKKSQKKATGGRKDRNFTDEK